MPLTGAAVRGQGMAWRGVKPRPRGAFPGRRRVSTLTNVPFDSGTSAGRLAVADDGSDGGADVAASDGHEPPAPFRHGRRGADRAAQGKEGAGQPVQ